jgi:hypothetical protein
MKTMTPKEKAYELISKFVGISLSQVNDLVDGIRIRLAKESALIAVEEILSARPLDPNHVDWDDCGATHQYWYEAQKDEALEFWNNVKSELQSL